MKICPSCSRHYEDDTLVYCLQDGAQLRSLPADADANATLRIPPPSPTQPGPTVFHRPPPAQSTITGRPEQFHFPGRQTAAESNDDRRRSNPLPWILAIVLVVGVFGVLIAWIATRGSGELARRDDLATPMPTVTVNSTPERRETPDSTPNSTPTPTPYSTPTPEATKPKPMFSVMDNTSMDGSRLTYYPSVSFGACQSDCARDPKCQGFTWIRPGAYNPSDPGMCYLMASVTGRSSHKCCISAVRN